MTHVLIRRTRARPCENTEQGAIHQPRAESSEEAKLATLISVFQSAELRENNFFPLL